MSDLHGTTGRKSAQMAALACAIILLSFLAATTGPAAAVDQAQPAGSPRLNSRLTQIIETLRESGIEGASAAAAQLDIDVQADSVRVIVEARPGLGTDAARSARRHGAITEGTYRDLVQALVG